jgi:hypothetical protein
MATAITRREAIRYVTALLGGAALLGREELLAVGQDEPARSAAAAAGVGPFTPDDVAFLDEVAETILPETSTPGAKAARTGAFMALMVTDAYDESEQQIFRNGMQQLDEACRQMHGVLFMQARPEQRQLLLQQLDGEQKAERDAREAAARTSLLAAARSETSDSPSAVSADAPVHYFRMMKELALLGYFTSEIGYHQAMRYVETPGRFDPCVPYTAGETIWASHA